jgi:hypothetical protein
MKKILYVTMTTFVLLFGTLAFSADKRVTVPTGDSPSMGPENAPITMIEFIDFQ